jgi:protein-tyrosine-phosphatase
MAEALLRHIDCRNFEAFSARPSSEQMDLVSTEVLQEMGIDFCQRSQKACDDLYRQSFDFVIALDDVIAKQGCPMPAGDVVHWRFETLPLSSDREFQRRILRTIRDQIAQRLRLFTIVHTRPEASAVLG